ncbi:type II toxin-antitoxin system HicA family toxin [Methylosarcina fibrata]|uniref:type II toxin-antitoxin system HicA family toxin n=1 Tax=Methylosarcina fibrata TaxID=105972 RepID=UPI0018DEDA75
MNQTPKRYAVRTLLGSKCCCLKMGNVPVLKPREIVALFEMPGFTKVRQRAHKQFHLPDGRCTTVSFHAGPDISPIFTSANR